MQANNVSTIFIADASVHLQKFAWDFEQPKHFWLSTSKHHFEFIHLQEYTFLSTINAMIIIITHKIFGRPTMSNIIFDIQSMKNISNTKKHEINKYTICAASTKQVHTYSPMLMWLQMILPTTNVITTTKSTTMYLPEWNIFFAHTQVYFTLYISVFTKKKNVSIINLT